MNFRFSEEFQNALNDHLDACKNICNSGRNGPFSFCKEQCEYDLTYISRILHENPKCNVWAQMAYYKIPDSDMYDNRNTEEWYGTCTEKK